MKRGPGTDYAKRLRDAETTAGEILSWIEEDRKYPAITKGKYSEMISRTKQYLLVVKQGTEVRPRRTPERRR